MKHHHKPAERTATIEQSELKEIMRLYGNENGPDGWVVDRVRLLVEGDLDSAEVTAKVTYRDMSIPTTQQLREQHEGRNT